MNTNLILFCNFNQVRILLHIVSEHTSEENNFIQVRVAKRRFSYQEIGEMSVVIFH